MTAPQPFTRHDVSFSSGDSTCSLDVPPALFAVLFAFGVWAVRRVYRARPASSARQILEKRFAHGEIDTEKFERRLRVL